MMKRISFSLGRSLFSKERADMGAASSTHAAHSARSVQIKTAKVTGRRELHFTSLGDMLADAELLCSTRPVIALGNWRLGRALEHLARSIEMSLDGAKFTPSWYIRWLGPWIKNRMITQPMRPGFQLPAYAAKFLIPEEECEMHDALAHLHSAVTRLQTTTTRHPSPLLGPLTLEEWNQLHLRHAELHLSFFVPK
jgi:hypothetical protein